MFRLTGSYIRLLAALVPLVLTPAVLALTPMSENEMSGVTGEGIALAFEDLRVQAGGTSYFEATGTPTVAGSQFQRADARYYGITLSGTTPVNSWTGICNAGIADMGCPIGDTIDRFAAFDNPFILRVADKSGIQFDGSTGSRTILELLGPTDQDPWRMGMWTEALVGGGPDKLQGQVILNNSTLTSQVNGENVSNKIRMLEHSNEDDPTVGFIWENHYTGDFRFSVNQTFLSSDQRGVTPFFGDVEGMYARHIQTYVPLGQLHYQSLILDDTAANDGNFIIEVTRLDPDASNAYNDFYSIADGNGDGTPDCLGFRCDVDGNGEIDPRPDRYFETHGYFRIGDWYPGSADGTNNSPTSTDDGIFFVAYDDSASGAQFPAYSFIPDQSAIDDPPTNNDNPNNGSYNVVNLGDGRIEGMLVKHLEIVTKGVQ